MNTELAWAAGFFDGEGCFSPRGGGKVILYLVQSDPRPLLRFVQALENVITLEIKGPYNPRKGGLTRKPYYRVYTSGNKATKVYLALAPYLSEPKKEQWQNCLDRVYEG